MVLDFVLLFGGGTLMSFFAALILNRPPCVHFFKLFIKSKRAQDIHKKNIYRIGGIIIFFSILTPLFLYSNFPIKGEWLALIFGMAILFLGGTVDDIFDLKPIQQFLFQAAAAAIFIIFGNVKIDYINAPLIGQVYLNDVFAVFIPFILIIFFINIFNFLDGIDGAAAGVGLLSFLTIFIISLSLPVKQIPPAVFSVIASGALLGFLFFNKPPAKIFLGTSGSNLIGFLLGALSIIAGSKILTLLMASILPAIDAFIVIIQRFKQKKSIFAADKSHLHHILLKKGMAQKNIFVLFVVLTTFFAISSLFMQNNAKFIFFIVFALISAIIIYKLKN